MKKIISFIIGFFLIPSILGSATAYLFNQENYETYISFWGSIYLVIYILFPLLYSSKIKQRINKYPFFAILYIVLLLLTYLTLSYATN